MRVPGFTWRPVTGLRNDPEIRPQLYIVHIDGNNAASLFDWFNGPSGGIESHLFTPRTDDNDNEQYRDTTREADANFAANSWIAMDGVRAGAISHEFGGRDDGKLWSPFQVSEMKRTMRIVHEEHGIPWKVAESPKGHGMGYHTLFASWSNVSGKTCPGASRIKQFHEVIVPWMEKQRPLIIDVKVGDTWRSLATSHDLTVAQLANRNPLKPGTQLRVR